MYNAHKPLYQFYDNEVRLGQTLRQELAKNRDDCIDRLDTGLKALGKSTPFEHLNQGSYAMHTLNKHPLKKYDIDVGLIFDAADLPTSALEARQMIAEAMVKGGGNFRTPPEAKPNAVRVQYADGHHVDFAIYRSYLDEFGNQIYEHAGPDWTPRDPDKVREWFFAQVALLSPEGDAVTVEKGQYRRVVRLLKAFAKSRSTWNLPGGLIISVLAAEQYVPDSNRDDIALYNTMQQLHNRLTASTEVRRPDDASQLLTGKQKYVDQVENLCTKLGEALEQLAVLQNAGCTEEQAFAAWNWVFQHDFWTLAEMAKSMGELSAKGSLYVSSSGLVSTAKPVEKSVPVQPHRFYGNEA